MRLRSWLIAESPGVNPDWCEVIILCYACGPWTSLRIPFTINQRLKLKGTKRIQTPSLFSRMITISLSELSFFALTALKSVITIR